MEYFSCGNPGRPDCSKSGPFAWCIDKWLQVPISGNSINQAFSRSNLCGGNPQVYSPRNSENEERCGTPEPSPPATAYLLDNWKLLLMGANSQADFDLVQCPDCNMLVPASSVRKFNADDSSPCKPSHTDVRSVNLCGKERCKNICSDRDEDATGSGAPTFAKKIRREKYGHNELSSVPLWARQDSSRPPSPGKDQVLDAIKRAADFAEHFEWIAAEELLLQAYDDNEDLALRDMLVNHAVFKKVAAGMEEYYQMAQTMTKAIGDLAGKSGKKDKKGRKAEKKAAKAAKKKRKDGDETGRASSTILGNGDESGRFASKATLKHAESTLTQGGGEEEDSLAKSGWKCVYEDTTVGQEARLWMLYDKKNMKGYYQAQTVIPAELTDCIMAYNELDLFKEWNGTVVQGPCAFGPRTASYMQAYSVLGIGPSMMQKRFATVYSYQRFIDKKRGWVNENLTSLPDGMDTPGFPKGDKIKGQILDSQINNMWFPTVDHNGKDATLVIQYGVANLPMKLPEWLVSLIGSVAAPGLLKDFKKASASAATHPEFRRKRAEDLSGLYHRIDDCMAMGKDKLGAYSYDGQSRLTPQNLPTSAVFRRPHDMRKLMNPEMPEAFPNWHVETDHEYSDHDLSDYESRGGTPISRTRGVRSPSMRTATPGASPGARPSRNDLSPSTAEVFHMKGLNA